MLKDERLKKILEMVQKENIVSISDMSKILGVTEMTIRRDLKILEEKGLIIRIHGGAKKKQEVSFVELSSNEKRVLHVEEKKYVAKLAGKLVQENDIIYIGPGTTNELVYDYITVSYAKVITNSMSVFLKFKDDSRFELILIGGKFRSRTDTFVGNFTNELLKKIRVKKAFIGVNGISNDHIMTANEEEALCQRIIMDNANEVYILCDSSKIGKQDFYSFYDLKDVTAVITDDKIDDTIKKEYENKVKIINE
ncbi:DeoR/GlpR family DNA-binding transcription regulator [Garciella nitratireducens]|uniref:Lactose phosphotransferase system repressor n=1 Tax=Garciella nitratireducens DSM 15102 TaxID=1121911 RepID=A0A1T4L2K6_9FIRM|nr:DeoR/GlpR family DNA-binding transcription regulator [Garciella nitratireducens]SJZ48777.1 transcriptional regulator, DeoR family [Garciella nitratireducens DSM 15102]